MDKMEFNEEQWLQIDQYLDGLMDPDQVFKFENKLASDQALRNELDFAWKLRQSVRQKEIDAFKEQYLTSPSWSRFLRRKKNLIGISLALLIVVAGIFIINHFKIEKTVPVELPLPNLQDTLKVTAPMAQDQNIQSESPLTNPDSNELIAMSETNMDRYLTDDFRSGGTKGAQDNSSGDTLSLAREAFTKKDWSKAIELYQKISNLSEYSSDYAKLGLSYLQIKKTKKSIALFRQLKDSALLPEWRVRGQWYLLLAYLTEGNKYQHEFEETLKSAIKSHDNDEEFILRFKKLEKEYQNLSKH